MNKSLSFRESLPILLKSLKLSSFGALFIEAAEMAEQKEWCFDAYLHYLATAELEDRKQRRIERLLKRANFPKGKTLASLNEKKLPPKIRRKLPMLCQGTFVEQAENVLAFGLPGRGKTHLLCAVGHELVQKGFNVLFIPAYKLVQRLLIAKRDLQLERDLKKLDRYDVILLDDIGYIQQSREEMEVLFTFLSQRYERKSVMITSNLVFSQWDRIFKDPMTTAAAIDRVVHHSIILECTGPSIRTEEASQKNSEEIKTLNDSQQLETSNQSTETMNLS